MTQSTQAISPMRQRMLDDMRMRKLSPKTQSAYIHAVRQFAEFLGRSPDIATDEDLRLYQLFLVDSGISAISLNATITGLKFFFEVTLGRAWKDYRAKGNTRHKTMTLSADEFMRRFLLRVKPALSR